MPVHPHQCGQRPVEHHLHVVPHVWVPVLIDGKAEDDDDGDGHINLMIICEEYDGKPCGGVEELYVEKADAEL